MKVHLCILLHLIYYVYSIPEEYYQPVRPVFGEDGDSAVSYTYLDTRSELQEKPETRRRSILDKNFARFGRGGSNDVLDSGDNSPDYNSYDYDLDYALGRFPRPTRSGSSGDKNDHFIRFGRADPTAFKYNDNRNLREQAEESRQLARVLRRSGNNNKDSFMRFGRSRDHHDSSNGDLGSTRLKREATSDRYYYKRPSGGGNNFVRFGRNDNFMRFGRDKQMTESPIDKNKTDKDSNVVPATKQMNCLSENCPLLQFIRELSFKLNQHKLISQN